MELQDVKVSWESEERFNVSPSYTLKEVINTHVDSLKYQLFNKDYSIKFNNNPLMKIILNTNIKDLINRFFGSRIDIELTPSSINELTELKDQVNTLRINLDSVINEKTQLIATLKNEFNKDKLHSKLKSLVKPFENNDYFLKMRNKILKRMAINNDILIKEAKDMKDNFEIIRKNDTIVYYNKMMENCLSDVYDFTYKYGELFLNDKELLGYLCEIFKQVCTDFLKKVNEYLRNAITSFYKNYTVNLDSCREYFGLIEQNVILYRAVRFLTEKQSMVSFKFDSPIKVKFSEITYRNITDMLASFPKPDILMSASNSKDFNSFYYFYAFERDLRIYNFFKVKMEDYAYGFLLYDN